jgi:hypothetical protein
MGAEEMAHANWRLDNPPVVDVAVSRRMGLFVVARLAARHGIRVRLRPAAAGGLTALVWLPDEVISHEADSPTPGGRRFDSPSAAGMVLPAVPGTVEDGMSATEQEINAARAPKFVSLAEPVQADGNGKLGVRRVPGVGPQIGTTPTRGPASTGPLPAFRSSPQAAEPDSGPPAFAAPAEMASFPPSEPFGTAPMPAVDLSPSAPVAAGADNGAEHDGEAALAAPPVAELPAAVVSRGARADHDALSRDTGARDVVVPAAEHVATENRLPIFEAVESDWFRRGRSGMGGWPGPQEAAPASAAAGTATDTVEPQLPEVAWTTPSDQGWEAAAAASSPTTGGTTTAGLPKRVPQANLVPGAATPESAAPAPTRSASATRERFSSFQRGSREGRAAATDDNRSDREDSSR